MRDVKFGVLPERPPNPPGSSGVPTYTPYGMEPSLNRPTLYPVKGQLEQLESKQRQPKTQSGGEGEDHRAGREAGRSCDISRRDKRQETFIFNLMLVVGAASISRMLDLDQR